MKSKLIKLLSLTCGVAILSTPFLTKIFADQPAGNLIVNGSFEDGAPTKFNLDAYQYTSYNGWNIKSTTGATTPRLEIQVYPGVIGGSKVHQYNGATYFAAAADGKVGAELSNTSIYQDITTIPGKTYTVKFAISSRYNGASDIKAEVGNINGTVQVTYNYRKDTDEGKWFYKTFTFTAPEGQTSTRIAFTSMNKSPYANEIDDISVTEYTCPNSQSSNLYIANSDRNTFSVLDTKTDTIGKTVSLTGEYPNGIASVKSSGKIFVTDEYSNSLSIVDGTTYTEIENVQNLGLNMPVGIVASTDGSKLYIANEGNETVSVYDIASKTVTNTIANVGNRPNRLLLAGNSLYVSCRGNDQDPSTIAVIDTTSNTLKAPITVGVSPRNMVLSPDGSKLYVACNGIGFGADGNNGNVSKAGSVFVIDTASKTASEPLTLGDTIKPWGIAISPNGSKLYVSGQTNVNGGENTVTLIDTANLQSKNVIYKGHDIWGIAISPDGSKLYVSDKITDKGSIFVLNPSTGQTISEISNDGIFNSPKVIAQ